jgi:hypothetical protein
MSKKRSSPVEHSPHGVTADRAARLYRLVKLLGRRPQPRHVLCAQLALTVRSFYRYLELLREVGIGVELVDSTYRLRGTVAQALDKLPFPDPGLTFGDVLQLAKGRTAAHRKLKAQVVAVTGERP